jgi:alpha-1,3-fucosyltransferase
MAFLGGASQALLRKTAVVLSIFCVTNLFLIYIPTKVSKIPSDFPESSPLLSDPGGTGEDFSADFPDSLRSNSLQVILANPKNESIEMRWNSHKGDYGEEFVYEDKPKKILIWNNYWESTAMWHKIFYEIINKQCPQSNCHLTVDKTELGKADAVLFHMIDIHKENYTFPQNRNPNQIWIGMTYEPPYILNYSGLNLTRLNGMFNRTMAYRSDSDIVVRHGTFIRYQKGRTSPYIFPSYLSNWVGSHDSTTERNFAEGKRRLVAWFASSRGCKSQSGREYYVREMQKHMEVDIYGGCGKYKCGKQKTMRNPYKVEHDDCYLLVSVAYKFVLAFENSICEDYVTEKLYNHLKLNVVPVVFGGANYSEYAPPHSIIDASKFTPAELTDYLKLLDKNDTLYNEYFEWKKDYAIISNDGVPLACDLCQQMHNPNWRVERKVYEQIDSWLMGGCKLNGWEATPTSTPIRI